MFRVASLLNWFRRPHGRNAVDTDEAQRVLAPAQIKKFERAIGYSFQRQTNLFQALVHRSYLQHLDHNAHSNERLEFLGDSILNLIVGEYLFHRFPKAQEGELTKMRSRLVNRKALAAYAKALRLSEVILMSHSAAQSIGKGYEAIIADSFEALIAAIYLDGGFEAARKFVERQVLSALKRGAVVNADENYKSMLLEYAQARGLGVPRYTIVKEEGPDHDRTFTVEVLLGNVKQGSGSGKNKKDAEQSAAGQALERLATAGNQQAS